MIPWTKEGMVPPAYSQVWWVSDLTKYCGITLWSSKGKEKLVQKSWHMKKYVHFTKTIFTQYSWQLYFKATSPWFCSNCDYSNACPEPRWFSWLCWRQTGEHSWVRHSLEYNLSMELLCSGFRAGPWCCGQCWSQWLPPSCWKTPLITFLLLALNFW